MSEKHSSLRMSAEICKRLEEGTFEEEIMDIFYVEQDPLLEYTKFALDNNWITRQNGNIKLQTMEEKLYLSFNSLDRAKPTT